MDTFVFSILRNIFETNVAGLRVKSHSTISLVVVVPIANALIVWTCESVAIGD
jgi:hypothetical protein